MPVVVVDFFLPLLLSCDIEGQFGYRLYLRAICSGVGSCVICVFCCMWMSDADSDGV